MGFQIIKSIDLPKCSFTSDDISVIFSLQALKILCTHSSNVVRLLLSRRSEENQSLVFGSSAVESAAKALLASIDTLGRMASNSELSGETSLFRQNVSPLVNVLPSDGVYRDTGGESGHRLKIIFSA